MSTTLRSLLTLNQPAYSPTSPIDHRVEMFQKAHPKDSFFNMRQLAARPISDATEMFDTDFEDDDSEIDDSNSPRLSINSVSTIAPRSHSLLIGTHRAANKVKQRYLPMKKYILQVLTHMSSKASTLASPQRPQSKDREARIYFGALSIQ
jgi:hypothetical protein